VINVLIYPPTALLPETVQNQLHHLQGQHQLQQDKIDRLLEELATLKNNSMDGMILLFLFVCLFVCLFFGVHLKMQWWKEYPKVGG